MSLKLDTEVLIIGAGSSGIGLAVQLKRKLGHDDFLIIERSSEVGGTWSANTYPGCGCDVASHFYSYSFALNPNWGRKYSLQPEIRSYFQDVAEHYRLLPKISFNTSVEEAVWDARNQVWRVTTTERSSKATRVLIARAVVSSVGALSMPKECEIPGMDSFQGRLFHSAKWESTFDWTDKSVVVVGNGCSATQFVPIISTTGPASVMDPSTSGVKTDHKTGPARQVTQFARQAHYLSERENPYYSGTFKRVMAYVPLAMRLYRLKIYADMEADFGAFHTITGQSTRNALAMENAAYVKSAAPERYWDALIPKHQIGCKRKVLDTDYLSSLWQDNVELVSDDPIATIVPEGVRTQSGRAVPADAIVLATGFQTTRMLFPMRVVGEDDMPLEQHWQQTTRGAPAAYLGTLVPGFPNFFILMGPNTVTGHLSVIYTIECQFLAVIALLKPLLTSQMSPSSRLARLLPVRAAPAARPTSVVVRRRAAEEHVRALHARLRDYVWSSGCTNWAIHEESGVNVAMYPHYQFVFWLRCLFLKGDDFEYTGPASDVAHIKAASGVSVERTKKVSLVVGFGWLYLRRAVGGLLGVAAAMLALKRARIGPARVRGVLVELLARTRA